MYFRSSNLFRFHSQKTRGQLLSWLDINVDSWTLSFRQTQETPSTPGITGEVELCKAQLDKVKKAQKAGPTDPGFHLSSTERHIGAEVDRRKSYQTSMLVRHYKLAGYFVSSLTIWAIWSLKTKNMWSACSSWMAIFGAPQVFVVSSLERHLEIRL